MLYQFQGHSPKATHQPWDGWVAPTATVIGQVELGKQVANRLLPAVQGEGEADDPVTRELLREIRGNH